MNDDLNTTLLLDKKTDRHLAAIIASLFLGTCLIFIFYILSQQQIKNILVLKQELETQNISEQNLNALNQFVDQEQDQLDRLLAFFPDEESIIIVLQDIELVLTSIDPEAHIGFTSEAPTRLQNEMQIPLRIIVHTTNSGLLNLLRELEKLPYMLEVTAIDIVSSDANLLAVTLTGRLYVSDPFVKPQ